MLNYSPTTKSSAQVESHVLVIRTRFRCIPWCVQAFKNVPHHTDHILLGELALASISTRCPHPDICFSVESPDQIDLGVARDIFLQVRAPVAYGGITLFHAEDGIDMDGFSIGADSKGADISVHHLLSQDEEEDLTLPKKVELLEGSGIIDGVMTASFRCKSTSS